MSYVYRLPTHSLYISTYNPITPKHTLSLVVPSPMDTSTTTTLLSLVALLSLITFILIKLTSTSTTTTKPLPPSPPSSLPLLGHLHLIQKPLHLSLAHLSSLYGPILLLRFGSRFVLHVSSLPLAQQCFSSTNDITFANRPHFPSLKTLTYNYTTLSFSPYGSHWRNLRRIATVQILSTHRLQLLSYIRHNEAELFVSSFFREYNLTDGPGEDNYKKLKKKKKVELKSRLFEFSFNVMMRMIAGKRYYGESGNKEEEARRFREMVDEVMGLLGASNASDFIPLLRWINFGGLKRKMKRLERKREVVLQGLINEERRRRNEEKKEEKRRNSSMLEVLLGLQEEDPEYYTDNILKALLVTLFFAGTDTSTVTIEWAMSFLINQPESLEIARNEIDSTIGNNRLLQEDDLAILPYLQAIISETLRLCPATPLLIPHESSQECTVQGYTVPRGTILLVNAWAIHRDPSIWTDPTEFKPERFLDGGSNKGSTTIPFGMGRRRCPGDGLASKVIGLVLGTMIHCFEWERIGEEMVDMSAGEGLTLHKRIPLQLMYRPRMNMINALAKIVN